MSAPRTNRPAHISESVSAILMADLRCGREHHPEAFWARRLTANGTYQLNFWCPQCRRPVTTERVAEAKGHAVSAEWLEDHYQLKVLDLPEVRDCVRINLCTFCGKAEPCEYHHVAPHAVFGPDADKFPVVPLCKPCHLGVTERFEQYIEKRIRKAVFEVMPSAGL